MIQRKWDGLSIVAAILCVVPEVVTTAYVGLPDDLGWALPILLLFSTAILAAPQAVMLAFMRVTRSKPLRILFLFASTGMLIAYGWFVPTVDLASDAQAGLAFPFFQFYMAAAAAMAGGIVLWVHRLLFDGGAEP